MIRHSLTLDLSAYMHHPQDGSLTAALRQGIKDGMAEPDDLGSGMTYQDQSCNELYDEGVNFGQAVARLLGRHPRENFAPAPSAT